MYIDERQNRETARDYALRNIKHNIVTLELEPGGMVSENELSLALGLSRTPIREAMIELSKSQIIEILPQRGSRVALVDYDLVEESRFMRFVLEKAVVELVCNMAAEVDFTALDENVKLQEFYLQQENKEKVMELDNQFHKELFRLCNKMQTYRLMNSMTTHFDRVRSMSLNTIKDIKIVQDHQKILQSLKAGDTAEAAALVTKHLSRYKVDEQEVRMQYPHYFKD